MNDKTNNVDRGQLDELIIIQQVAGELRELFIKYFDKYKDPCAETNETLKDLSQRAADLSTDISCYWGELIISQCK